ncbi:MAG: xanthine dehydrogenase family protein molybdopterin-binding subunit [Acidimicrobiales bacterium]
MSILGNRVQRFEDPDLLTGAGDYVDDVTLPAGAAHVVFVRSPLAYARIEAVDTSEALAAPGVLAVVTAADLDLADLEPEMMFLNAAMKRPLLARDVVRFVGEPVAAVVADTRAQAVDAAEQVIIDYDPLDAVVDPEQAHEHGSTLFPDAESPLAMEIPGDLVADFDGCEAVVEQRIVNQRVSAAPIEPRAAAGWWEDGRLIMWSSCQGAHPVRDKLAAVYGLDPAQVRVVVPHVGGSFGAKNGELPEELLIGDLARRVGRPVRWAETRSESMTGFVHGRGQIQQVKIGGNRDGKVTAYSLSVIQDSGAYPMLGAVLPFMTRMMTSGVYAITNVGFESTSVVTNTTPMRPFRGAGRPEAAAAVERAMDLFATEIGMDPAEVRRRNLLADDVYPYSTPGGAVYDIGAYTKALDMALEASDYAGLRAEQARRREAGDTRQLGIGLSVYVEITALGGGGEFGTVTALPDGTVEVRTGATPFGQGHDTTWKMLASDRLGVSMEAIRVIHGDTDDVAEGSTTGGSRSVQVAGSSILSASAHLIDLARERAAELLEAAVDDVVLDTATGRFHVAGVPAVGAGWGEVARQSGEPLMGASDFTAEGPTFPFGAHVAVVEVDTETGAVVLTRLVAVDDAGTLINPMLADGQIHGGLAQGAAQALFEEMTYDEDGNPQTANLADYTVPAASEVPSFERIEMVTPTPLNELGAKGIGESGSIGSTPAVQNAVVDAVSHLGVRHIDMPCSPERVWRAIQAARG